MRIYENGVIRDMTEAEMAAVEEAAARYEAEEKKRPLTAEEVTGMLIAAQINTLSVDDATALRMVQFYPEWTAGTAYSADYRVQRSGKLWRCVQAHTAQEGWEPENAAALWTQIDESHAGTQDDPIPYEGNMALESGKYYTQGGVTYRCTRDTGNPVYSALEELVGLYVEVGD